MSRGHRASTTPMEFEWTNQTGPVDSQSPFFTASQQSAKKRKLSTLASVPSAKRGPQLTSGPFFGQPGPHSVLDSPSKNVFATPNRLRDPDNRPFFFSQSSSKPLPSIPAHVQNAWEPRTPASTYDSSGGETPNTPQVDSDAGTPDTQTATSMGRLGLGNGDSNSPKKAGRRDSWFKRLTGISSPTPIKERDKDVSQKYYSKKAENRIVKRRSERTERSRSKKRHALRDDGDDSDDAQEAVKGAAKEQGVVKQTFAMSIAGFLSWIEAHPNLPSVLSYYLQLTVNAFLGFLFLYIVYSAWCGVMMDVDIESSKHASEVMVEIAACATEYNRNRCRPEEVVPAMEKACGVWETCMNRDPKKVARASVTAKTFAMIFNSFVEEFSYKSMVCVGFLVFVAVYTNGQLRQFRAWSQRWEQEHADLQASREQYSRAHAPLNAQIPRVQAGHQQQTIAAQPDFEVEQIFTAIIIFGGFNLSNWAFGLLRSQQQHQTPNPNDFVPQTPHRIPSNSYIEYNQQAFQQNWQQQNTPYQTPYGGIRHIEAPPPLVHAQSMPAVPTASQDGGALADERKTPRKKGLFR
ncbi:Nn.00g059310.m01.CDS01 [Neocucurbitaria sp. VM-36]